MNTVTDKTAVVNNFSEINITITPTLDEPWIFKTIPLSQALDDAQNGTYADKVAPVRAEMQAHGKGAKYKRLKDRLGSWVFAGTFKSRIKNVNLEHHSQLMHFDIDEIPESAELPDKKGVDALFKRLADDVHTVFLFRSPSNAGLKGAFWIDKILTSDADHKKAFYAVEKYMLDEYEVTIDKLCKDVRRYCFFSHDPDLYRNPKAPAFHLPDLDHNPAISAASSKNIKFVKHTAPYTDREKKRQKQYVEKHLENACATIRNSVPGGQHKTRRDQGKRMGHMVDFIDDMARVESELIQAVIDSGAEDVPASIKTLRDGLNYGMKVPDSWEAVKQGFIPQKTPSVKVVAAVEAEAKKAGVDPATLKNLAEKILETKKKKTPSVKMQAAVEAEAKKAGVDPATLKNLAEKILETKKKKPTPAEYQQMLREAGYKIALNTCDDRIYVNGEPISDVIEAEIVNWTDNNRIRIGVEKIRFAITGEAARNKFNPIKDYLNGLEHDGGAHIDALGGKLETSDPDIIYPDGRRERPEKVFLKKWMVGAVSKVFRQTQNPVFVMDGAQGLGKSLLAEWLCSGLPGAFCDQQMTGNLKDVHKWMITKFIWEIGELDATTRKADVSLLKSLISKRVVDERFPYARHAVSKPACASFIGTVNGLNGFLTDPTGNRRFVCVEVKSIDWSYTELEADRLWAEAVNLYNSGYDHELDATERAYRDQGNKKREMSSPLDGLLERHFQVSKNPSAYVTSGDIVSSMDTIGIRLQTTITSGRNIAAAIGRVFSDCHTKRGRGGKRYNLEFVPNRGPLSRTPRCVDGVDKNHQHPISTPISTPQDSDFTTKNSKCVDSVDKNGTCWKKNKERQYPLKTVNTPPIPDTVLNTQKGGILSTLSTPCDENAIKSDSSGVLIAQKHQHPISTPTPYQHTCTTCTTCTHKNGVYCKKHREGISTERIQNGCVDWAEKTLVAV